MSLIKSISGIRGTIGGRPGENLTPLDIVKFSAAYGMWIKKKGENITIVIGRDGRKSGPEVAGLVSTTLLRSGVNVIDLGFATTPTVEMAVVGTGSAGGIIITASHNPAQWNALKLLNEKGEFLSSTDGGDVLAIAADEDFDFAPIDHEGKYIKDDSWNRKHIEKICALELVDVDAIKSANFKVALDCVNSVGGIILPDLLNALGVKSHIGLNMIPNGCFAHNPEPLPENLKDIMSKVVEEKADLAFVVDPDVDRLAIVCEDGSYFGEEYTLVAVSDYILSNKKGCTVSNMSSSMALQVVSNEHGCDYFSAPVGEVNVVTEMKKRGAVIGGEGNGGVIYPELHYGRDALVGIALFLTHLAKSGLKCSQLRKKYPNFVMAKNKVAIEPTTDFDFIKSSLKGYFKDAKFDERDGLKIQFEDSWIHIRKSNTEPIIRIYTEAKNNEKAVALADEVISLVKKL
ncbi:MAG: phosphoglucosamine mutase [Bacteroidales bacterium]|nr:phosphoglucosamine mutase [Bacteroidales bacterium]